MAGNQSSFKELKCREKELCSSCGLLVKCLRKHYKNCKLYRTLMKYPCPHCNKVYATQNRLCDHQDKCQKKPQRINHVPMRWNHSRRFSCVKCGRKFKSQYNALRHPTICKNLSPSCDVCGIRHKKNTTGCKTTHQCSICQKRFRFKNSLLMHVKNRVCEKKYACNVCGEIIMNQRIFGIHRKHCIGLPLSTKKQCPLCNRSFSCRANLYEHFKQKTCQKKWICNSCGNKFTKLRSYMSHKTRCTAELPTKPSSILQRGPEKIQEASFTMHTNKENQCPLCCKEFLTRICLVTHIRKKVCQKKSDITNHTKTSMEGPESDENKCQKCGRTFAYKDSLKKHTLLNKCHLVCKTCLRMFRSAENLSCHQILCRETTVLSECRCPHCNHIFKREDTLKFHLKNKICQRNLSCHNCGRKYKSQHQLTLHEKNCNTLTQPKPKCPKCDRQFTNMLIFKSHLLNKKCNLVCKTCGRMFRNGLSYHRLYCKGRELSKIQCPYCKRIFSGERGLINHLKHKTCRRNYICFNCGKQCDDAINLDYHKLKCTDMADTSKFLPDKPKCFNCKGCFRSAVALQTHYDSQRCFKNHYSEGCIYCDESKPFFCMFCNKQFRCQFLRDRHSLLNKPQSSESASTVATDKNMCTPATFKFWCPYCDTFHEECSKLAVHLREVHGLKMYHEIKEIPFARMVIRLPGGPMIDGIVPLNTCFVCKKRFYSKRYSKYHTRDCIEHIITKTTSRKNDLLH